MTAVRARRHIVAVLVTVFGFSLSNLSASELNDSIQSFHRGDYKTAFQGLSTLVQNGHQDARVHYYRGLISFRQGNRQAAAADFQAAMQMEAAGHTQGVSESLQRVQGNERLVIEKYRAMARLASKQRTQPIAPAPVVSASTGSIQLVTAEMHGQAPVFRLASEVPIRSRPTSDPFVDDKSLLVDEAPASPTAVPSSTSTSEEPVGTGVATNDDPFADVDSMDASDFGAADESAPSAKPTTVIGSVFRALFRANVPNVPALTNSQGVLPPGIGPGAQPPAGPGSEEPAFGGDDSIFGDEPMDEDDPFGDL